ncbi:hypothetical protein [Clostridium culturomicium]|uniref:hypothetical protein n=1 Tax=Clostridium culturomicium TaxID=1499683 RepID=UPI00058DA0C4|nr:hypothetical protein [Clostridium culturomicium]
MNEQQIREGLKRLIRLHGTSAQFIANKIGKSRETVTKFINDKLNFKLSKETLGLFENYLNERM